MRHAAGNPSRCIHWKGLTRTRLLRATFLLRRSLIDVRFGPVQRADPEIVPGQGVNETGTSVGSISGRLAFPPAAHAAPRRLRIKSPFALRADPPHHAGLILGALVRQTMRYVGEFSLHTSIVNHAGRNVKRKTENCGETMRGKGRPFVPQQLQQPRRSCRAYRAPLTQPMLCSVSWFTNFRKSQRNILNRQNRDFLISCLASVLKLDNCNVVKRLCSPLVDVRQAGKRLTHVSGVFST